MAGSLMRVVYGQSVNRHFLALCWAEVNSDGISEMVLGVAEDDGGVFDACSSRTIR